MPKISNLPRRGFSKQRRAYSLGAMVLNCLTEDDNEAGLKLEGKSLREMEGLVGERPLERGACNGGFGVRVGAMPETRRAQGRAIRRGRFVGLNMLNASDLIES